MPGQHAKLSPSAAARWLHCTAAPTLEETFPETSSEYAYEGTLAHALAELFLTKHFTRMRKTTFDKNLEAIKEDPLYTEAMLEHCTQYRDYVAEQYYALPKDTTFVEVEKQVDLAEYIPDGYGKCDCVLISDRSLHVIDFKYGKGVPVDAEQNPQLMLYALGALKVYEPVYDIDLVAMTIFQPRLDSISTYEISAEDLSAWGEGIKETAKEAFNGPGVFAPGEDTCRFCKAKAICKARADRNLELTKYDFADPLVLSPEEIADILTKLKEFDSWSKDIKDYALEEAKNGQEYPGWKLVEGRSNRIYSDREKVLALLLERNFNRDEITELIGITALEKSIGKKAVEDILGDLIIKPEGKPALAPLSDKRAAISSIQSAINDFSEGE